jgi:hypothetical protein
MIARAKAGRQPATASMISDSSSAVPAVVQPTPIVSITGPWTSEPIG